MILRKPDQENGKIIDCDVYVKLCLVIVTLVIIVFVSCVFKLLQRHWEDLRKRI